MRRLGISTMLFFLIVVGITCQNQNMDNTKLPYHEIPEAPEKYTAANVAARTIDGLGYRYYWASEGLTEKDLAFRPSDDGRTTAETLDHIYGLSRTIANAIMQKPNVRPVPKEELSFADKRRKTLENFKVASDLLRSSKKNDMKDFNIVFQRGETRSEFPFWNLLNGPIADAIYHTGQIVSYRRSSGNPMNPKVSVFSGKNRE